MEVDMFDLDALSNEQLEQQLYNEIIYYSDDLEGLCRILRKQLPRRMTYRIISKLFRLRNGGK